MKLLRLTLALLLLVLMTPACSSKDPGPLAAGNSRIKVQCTGFALGSYQIQVTNMAGMSVGPTQDLGCIFSDAVYFDVPVPPNDYKVFADNQLYQTVSFSGPGIQLVVRITALIVGGSSSF